MVTVEREVVRVKQDERPESVKDEVVVEDQVELYINDACYAIFSCSPSETKELVVGHLFTEGVISKIEEIESLEICEGKVRVGLTGNAATRVPEKPQMILSSCCSRGLKVPPRLWMKPKIKCDRDFVVKPQTILKSSAELNSQSSVFKRTGGTHASAIFDGEGKMLGISEDIGRHNAIDKVIGKAVLNGVEILKAMLVSTGRLTSEMVVKAASARVPIVVSMAAPTDKGIQIAEMTSLTLVGFARVRRFNVYTNPKRIVFDEELGESQENINK